MSELHCKQEDNDLWSLNPVRRAVSVRVVSALGCVSCPQNLQCVCISSRNHFQGAAPTSAAVRAGRPRVSQQERQGESGETSFPGNVLQQMLSALVPLLFPTRMPRTRPASRAATRSPATPPAPPTATTSGTRWARAQPCAATWSSTVTCRTTRPTAASTPPPSPPRRAAPPPPPAPFAPRTEPRGRTTAEKHTGRPTRRH